MGFDNLRCMLGFSVVHSNSFSARLEGRCASLAAHYREANTGFLLGIDRLHDAVDAAVQADRAATAQGLANGLALLAQCNDHLTAIADALVQTRADLFERGRVDAGDPLIAREPFFRDIDPEATYREFLAHGAALPQRTFWDDLAARVREGGARAGLLLLQRHVRELQTALRAFVADVERVRPLPLGELAERLHSRTLGVAATVMGFTRLLVTFTYFSILCERASALHERSLGSRPLAATG